MSKDNPVPVIAMIQDCLRDPEQFAAVKHVPMAPKHDGMTCKDCGKLVAMYSHQTGDRFCSCEIV